MTCPQLPPYAPRQLAPGAEDRDEWIRCDACETKMKENRRLNGIEGEIVFNYTVYKWRVNRKLFLEGIFFVFKVVITCGAFMENAGEVRDYSGRC